jgi:hypothetical protein
MGFRVTGAGGVDAEVGAGNLALRVQQMPVEFGSLGIYKKSLLSGTMAAGLAGNAVVYSWRWGDATRLGVVQKVTLDGLSGSATAFTAGFGKVDMMIGRSFTASNTGGTAGTLTGNNSKLRTGMGTTLLTDVRIASTAALAGGTVTLDTDPVGQISLTFGVVVSVQYANTTILFGEDVGPEHPLVFAQNEGFQLRATVPATGTWQFGVSCRWAEVTAF